jgi:hypothetical protein
VTAILSYDFDKCAELEKLLALMEDGISLATPVAAPSVAAE